MRKLFATAPTLLLAFSLVNAPEASAFGSKAPAVEHYEEKSLVTLASRAGVEPETLRHFYEEMRSTTATQNERNSVECAQWVTHEPAQRDLFLECLSTFGRPALSAELGQELFVLRSELLGLSPTIDRNQTLALIGYTEDLVRENLREQGEAATWIDFEGYSDLENKGDFEFQDGDVVVGLGNSSISSLISQINDTASRYSHAFIVRKREGKMTTIESLIETGVKEFPLEHFLNDPYNQLTVLRWKNEEERAQIAALASDWAKATADRDAPYDMEMDFDEDHKIYCSELIVKAYANAAELDNKEILSHFSTIKSDKAFEYASNLGVKKKVYASPGDLFNSPHFEVVAEFRKKNDLVKAWELYLMGDLFLEKIDEGYEVMPGPLYTSAPLAIWFAQLLPSIFHEDARLIPKSVGPWALAIMATTQKNIYDIAIDDYMDMSGKKRSLLEHAPWEMRGAYERRMKTHFKIDTVFGIPKPRDERHPRRRGGRGARP